jgi:hypothetical protein
MKRLLIVGQLLLMISIQSMRAQELLGDSQFRRATAMTTPPRSAIALMNGSVPWNEVAVKEAVSLNGPQQSADCELCHNTTVHGSGKLSCIFNVSGPRNMIGIS